MVENVIMYKESVVQQFDSDMRKILHIYLCNKKLPVDVALGRITVLQQDLSDSIRLDEQQQEEENAKE